MKLWKEAFASTLPAICCLALLTCEETEPLKPNHNPEIVKFGLLGTGVQAGHFATLICVVEDEDHDSLEYFWSAPEGTFYGSGDTVSWRAPLEISLYPIYCRVEDGHGGYVEVNFHVQVYPNMIFSESAWTIYTPNNSGLDNGYLWAVAVDENDQIWLGDDAGLLTHFDGVDWQSWRVNNTETMTIDFDNLNNVWVCANGVVAQFDGTTISYHQTQRRYANNITIDPMDNIWVSYSGWDTAPSKFDGTNWTNFDSLGIPYAFDIAIDHNNHIWYTADSALVHYDHDNWIVHEGPTPGWHRSIAIDSQNHIWVATNTHEVAMYDHTGWTYIPSPFSSGHIHDIVVDDDDNVWVAYELGIAILNAEIAKVAGVGAWQTILTPDNSPLPPGGGVTSLYFDSRGHVWGTQYYAGVFKIDLSND